MLDFSPQLGLGSSPKLPSRNSNNLSSGVVGLANVGKSTFFQAITKTKLGNPANYPFATIEPEESKILVQSTRLDKLSKLYGSKKKIPTSLKIFDIAGLTRNASNGEGLGNKFLEDIRQVDGIFQIVRGFRDDSIIHIENNVDPVRDLVIVMDELILKDLEFVESGIDKLEKTIKKPNQPIDKMKKELKLLEEFQEMLYEGKKIGTFKFKDIESVEMTRKYNFLTIKPTVYLLNVNKEDYLRNDTEFKKDIEVWLQENCPNDKLMLICAQYENDKLDNPQEEDTESNRLNGVVEEMRDSLSLISYFTCGPQEAREWTIKRGTGAADAAAVIHNDLKDSFIAAQVYKYSDVIKLAEKNEKVNESELKAKGLQYRYGKDHVVEDGDIILFKSAKGKH
ncbi:hypothetical protein CANTEDRAFT_112289 [Yamadazyma tenuis ATCC 10573]|uniref:Obg-like ATPase 1 n=1 Tax=Candida tenuis (strain ATCC 10573 / BCRC 21748 / CBS 615 / JCM 9827 / NBRC 10315 / NRRL Y-1498 / VKM Y-70) TaxID=590646 RepID=G3AWM6_CANTC|nr:uncharacterized protein CANTEDRAFT_112289 [Yamadazyma tenuis ATCC 10573]EGV66825.1 hypothetical protein CANTEDRAFT_112289 [Yamadazyma tenuis ATCC 10573]